MVFGIGRRLVKIKAALKAHAEYRMLKCQKGESSLIDWVIGVILLSILGVGVAVPIVINTVNSVLPNVSGTTATIIDTIPVVVAVVILLMFFGRR